jgi:hypothetical protein
MVDVPGVARATGTIMLQIARLANVTPLTTIDVAPDAAVTVPPQLFVTAPLTVMPAGNANVYPIPEIEAGNVFVNCNVNVEVVFAKVPANAASNINDWKFTNCSMVRSTTPAVLPRFHCTIKPASCLTVVLGFTESTISPPVFTALYGALKLSERARSKVPAPATSRKPIKIPALGSSEITVRTGLVAPIAYA